MPWYHPYDATRFAEPENRGRTHMHLASWPNAARITGKQARVCPTALAEQRLAADCLQLTLWINAGTASSAERFAGVLQWHHRAELVGAPTSGKRTVQQVVRLDQAHLLFLTTGRFLAPDSSPFGVHRLTPDRVYEGDDAVSLMGPCADTTPTGP